MDAGNSHMRFYDVTSWSYVNLDEIPLLNIHKRLAKTRGEKKEEELLHSLALALTLTLTFNHLANKLLQVTTMLLV